MRAEPSDAILARLLDLHPKIIDLVLDRVWRLLDVMGNPERALPPVLHVAGTNGKGSVVAMMRAGIEGAGLTAHAYTSPHLVRFHERIRVAGRLIAEPDLTRLLEECEAANGGAPITFFEITTVAALLAFSRSPADYTLLEVGLGGRLDATNVVARPRLTAITPVSLDHQHYLGDTLGQIAWEKAGILKRGVPCIVGPQAPEAMGAIERRAAEVAAPLRICGQDWHVRREHGRLVFEDDDGLLDLDPPRLTGAHQTENAGIALAGLRALGLPPSACQSALTEAVWPARMQRLRGGPLAEAARSAELWLDGGHNPAAGAALAAHLAELDRRHPTRLGLVVGMLETKAATGFLSPFASLSPIARTVTIPGAPAAFPADALATRAVEAGLAASAASSVADAVAEVRRAGAGRILICGSLYLAGHVLAENAED